MLLTDERPLPSAHQKHSLLALLVSLLSLEAPAHAMDPRPHPVQVVVPCLPPVATLHQTVAFRHARQLQMFLSSLVHELDISGLHLLRGRESPVHAAESLIS